MIYISINIDTLLMHWRTYIVAWRYTFIDIYIPLSIEVHKEISISSPTFEHVDVDAHTVQPKLGTSLWGNYYFFVE